MAAAVVLQGQHAPPRRYGDLMSGLERIVQTLAIHLDHLLQAALLIVLGSVVSVGRDMQARYPEPIRIVIGRAISTGILALGAGSALAIIPGLPLLALLGIAATLASLGAGFLERIATAWLTRGRK